MEAPIRMKVLQQSDLDQDDEMGVSRDWRKALRSQPAYRVVNRTIRTQTQFISMVAFVGVVALFLLYMLPRRSSSPATRSSFGGLNMNLKSGYNYTYPLSAPIRASSQYTFRIGVIADLDTNSKSDKNEWFSYLMKGWLTYSPKGKTVAVTWDTGDPLKLTGGYSLKGRGMELSELVVFDGRLLTFDDRTGLVYEIVDRTVDLNTMYQVVPWLLLTDGDGRTSKGFKSEWATVKDETLYVGSMGKEWTTPSGEFESHNPQFIKTVTTRGQVGHVDWINQYKRIREVLGIFWPGYMIHESGLWSDVHHRWFFLPRRCSKEPYNESLDEHRGCSVLISADENLYDVKATQILNSQPTRGFSTFKFIPTSNDEVIVALRTEELEGKTSTYVTAFDIDGKTILPDVKISDFKYEGLEFI